MLFYVFFVTCRVVHLTWNSFWVKWATSADRCPPIKGSVFYSTLLCLMLINQSLSHSPKTLIIISTKKTKKTNKPKCGILVSRKCIPLCPCQIQLQDVLDQGKNDPTNSQIEEIAYHSIVCVHCTNSGNYDWSSEIGTLSHTKQWAGVTIVFIHCTWH